MFKTKILILGTCQSGKTTISNFVADTTDYSILDYRPTQGVRIVEFESNQLQINGKNIDADVELWDCSGDKKFEKCWPSIQHEASGIILVADRHQPNQIQELDFWFTHFVQKRDIKPSNVRIFLTSKNDNSNIDKESTIKLPNSILDVQIVHADLERSGDVLRNEFNNFLCDVITDKSIQRDKDELNIIS